MLTLKRISPSELPQVYPSMRREFPDDERKPLDMLERQTQQGIMEPWWLMEDGVRRGYAMMLTAPGCPMVLLDYLAMLDKGKGYGTACLKLLQSQYPGGILVEAEAEQPGLAPDEAAHRARRLRFYNRGGFVPLRWQAEVFEVVYQLLFWSEEPDSGESCADCYRRIYENQLPPRWMHTHFAIREEKKIGNILVTIPMDEGQKARLSAIAPEAEVVYCPADRLTPALLGQAEIILGNLPVDMVQHAVRLKWLQLSFAGSDNFCTPGLLPEDVLLTNATGAYGLAISECMLAGIFYHIKRLGQYHDQQRQHLWRNCGEVRSIEGSVTLAVGLGDIGSSFARRMNGLGSTVFGIRRHVTQKPPYLAGLFTMDKLDELLPLADYVALSLPNSPATRNVMNAARFARMKKDAILVNVGRGSAVDTDALVEALNGEQIGGAVIDVVHQEPLPPDHPLWEAKNLLLTPHVTGNYNLPETKRRVVNIALDNLAAYLHGGELVSVVDRSTGYRKFS